MVEEAGGWDGSSGVRSSGDDAFTARLDRWVADARIGEAALQRSRERWLREVAEQEATLGGVLVDLTERQVPVTVQLRDGSAHHGLIRVVGADFVDLELRSRADVLLAMSAIALVRTAPEIEPTVGDRMIGTDLRLADVLAELAADRAHVALTMSGGWGHATAGAGHAVVGVLRSVGHDVAALRPDAEARSTVYVVLSAVTQVLLR